MLFVELSFFSQFFHLGTTVPFLIDEGVEVDL
jgi:hypothetical protein